jgi:hypothetical protein
MVLFVETLLEKVIETNLFPMGREMPVTYPYVSLKYLTCQQLFSGHSYIFKEVKEGEHPCQ